MSYVYLCRFAPLSSESCKEFAGQKKYYSTGDFSGNNYELVSYNSKPSRANLILKTNQITLAKMKATEKICIVTKEMEDNIYSTGFFAINSKNIDVNYLFYLLQSPEFIQEKDSLSFGTTQFALNEERYKKIKVNLIDDKEKQILISDVLYKKCEEIDSLIEVENKQIEKLKEYKQAVITEAVTKGLDKNAPMKDSGVEWIGKILSSSLIKPLKFLLSEPMMYGANESGLREKKLDGYRYIRITDIDGDGNLKDTDENQYLSKENGELFELSEGDVLFARSGGTVGKTFIYHESYGKSAFAGYLIKGKCDLNKLLPEYLYLYTQSSIYELWKQQIFIQATIQNIGANKYSMLPVISGTLNWQKQIVSYVQDKVREINSLIEIKQQKINQLEEYKKSLIYEYVTGKKEV